MSNFKVEAAAEKAVDPMMKVEKTFKYTPILTAIAEDGKEVRVKGQAQELSVQQLQMDLQMVQSQLAQLAQQKAKLEQDAANINAILAEIEKIK